MVGFLIERPVSVIMAAAGILILGLLSIFYIPISLLPGIDVPELTVQITARNLSAREIERSIVEPLRTSLMQTSHLRDLQCETVSGFSKIMLKFHYGTDTDFSFIEVNEKIDRAMFSLPKNTVRPRVIKANITNVPVFYLNLFLKGPAKNEPQAFYRFNRFAAHVIKKRIEQLEEVAMVDISGVLSTQIVIVPYDDKLRSLGIGHQDIEDAVRAHNIQIGNLVIRDNQYQYNITADNRLNDIGAIGEVILKKGRSLFRLKELARIEAVPQPPAGLVLVDNGDALTMAIIKSGDAQMSALKRSLSSLISTLKSDYPDIEFQIIRDQTELLDYSLNNLIQDLVQGVILGFIVLFVFLQTMRTSVLIGITVPTSLIVCLLLFHLIGITINIISLAGLILAVGLMVDNSIIVIDNISQYHKRGLDLFAACVTGTKEVISPLISSAMTTCAVFIPLIFLSGIAGALFYDQAVSITIGLLASLLVSIMLMPVLFYLVSRGASGKKPRMMLLPGILKFDYALLYERSVSFILRHQRVSWMIFLTMALLSAVLYFNVPRSVLPEITSDETLVDIDWNEDINIEESKRRMTRLLDALASDVSVSSAFVGNQQFLVISDELNGPSHVNLYVKLKDGKVLSDVKKKIAGLLVSGYASVRYEFRDVDNIFNTIFPTRSSVLVAKLYLDKTISEASVQHTWKLTQQNISPVTLQPIGWQDQLVLEADMERLMRYDVSSRMLYDALERSFSKREILTITSDHQLVPLIMGSDRTTIFGIINSTYIRSADSLLYPAREFITVREAKDLKMIHADINGQFLPFNINVSEADAFQLVDALRQFDFLRDFRIDFTGSVFETRTLLSELTIVIALSLLFLYFILAIQFQSFALPVIILAEIPIDLVGCFLFLKMFGSTINLMSLIGIVVMSGIVINDSILKVSTINLLRKNGCSLMRAIIVGGHRRLKSIIMTSLTTMLALVPLLFSSGLGAELQKPLALSLIGGMMVGTIVSLLFVPLCYYALMKGK